MVVTSVAPCRRHLGTGPDQQEALTAHGQSWTTHGKDFVRSFDSEDTSWPVVVATETILSWPLMLT